MKYKKSANKLKWQSGNSGTRGTYCAAWIKRNLPEFIEPKEFVGGLYSGKCAFFVLNGY